MTGFPFTEVEYRNKGDYIIVSLVCIIHVLEKEDKAGKLLVESWRSAVKGGSVVLGRGSTASQKV